MNVKRLWKLLAYAYLPFFLGFIIIIKSKYYYNSSSTVLTLNYKIVNESDLNDTWVITTDIKQTSRSNEVHESNKKTDSAFRDVLFQPILEAFRVKQTKPRMRFRGGDVPLVSMYVGPKWVRKGWFYYHFRDINKGVCPHKCLIEPNLDRVAEADAVLIHIRSVTSVPSLVTLLSPRDPSQPWIGFDPETPFMANNIFHVPYATFNGVFNRTFYYRRDADATWVHGFLVARGEAGVLPKRWVRGTAEDAGRPLAAKTHHKLAVAFISHCKARSDRLEYVREMQRHGAGVDLYGKCGNKRCGKSLYIENNYKAEDEPCLKVAAKYYFYLSFENAKCRDYTTEKLYNILYYPVVPVVMGGANYADIMPPHSYIDSAHYTPKELVAKLQYLMNHPREYQAYLAWRKHYLPSTVGGARVFCDFCKKLHDPAFYRHKSIYNFTGWFVEESGCEGI